MYKRIYVLKQMQIINSVDFLHCLWSASNFAIKMATTGLFFVYFCLLKQTLQFLQQIYVKKIHPVYRAGIRTHDLNNMILLP